MRRFQQKHRERLSRPEKAVEISIDIRYIKRFARPGAFNNFYIYQAARAITGGGI
jgi:hypothetical protein